MPRPIRGRLSLHPIHGGMMPRPIHVLVGWGTLIFTSRHPVCGKENKVFAHLFQKVAVSEDGVFGRTLRRAKHLDRSGAF